jgi:nucleotide-binding universal stress UspA family protein
VTAIPAVSTAIPIVVGVLCLVGGLAAGYWLLPHGHTPLGDRSAPARRMRLPFTGEERSAPVRRILLPFTGEEISRRAVQAAIRLAKAENAVIMPAFLARVPMSLPLDTPLPRQCTRGMPLLEAIDQRISSQGLPVDARVSRGRSARDALRRLLDEEHFDRIIISADEDPWVGLSYDDLQWMLERVPAEIMILRPAPDDERRISAASVSGHF